MKEAILKYVLKNALQFNGKANPKVVLGLVLKDNPNLKKDVPKLLQEIEKTVKEVEKLDSDKIRKELEKISPELLKEEKIEIEGPLKPLPNAKKGKTVFRIAPSPSGALHIGHAYGAALNYEYSKMYNGKLILRIEDTNPENIYPAAYELIENDIQWLTDNNLAEVILQSSRLGNYYDSAEKLVQLGKAYVCTCDADEWRVMKSEGKACLCRALDTKENQLRYAKMFNSYPEGGAVLRLKTDISHKNPAMRDFAIMRISKHLHPKTKKEHQVWPLMVLSVAVDDHELGITHVLNGKDHTDNSAKEKMIMEYLGWSFPEYKHWGMINFEGFALSSSATKLAIEQKDYTGWEDIRLPFLPSLRRRGYQPEAFRHFAIEIGLSLTDKKVSKEEFWKMINSFNKEIVEDIANRYFFIDDPLEISLLGSSEKKIEINLHPGYPERGKRNFQVGQDFKIANSDFKRLGEGYLHRLMDCCNFELRGNKFFYVSDNYQDYKNAEKKGNIIHWLPAYKNLKVDVLLDNGRTISGLGEENMNDLQEGDIIQMERRYFARLDKKNKGKLTFWYLHK